MHWNPWEKVDKKTFLKTLQKTSEMVKKYEQYEFMTKKFIPRQIHENIMKLAGAISKCEKFYAYYQDAKAIYEAIEVLNKTNMQDSMAAARAFGKLFVALAAIAVKAPAPVPQYAQPIKVIGEKFEKIVEKMMPTHGNHEYDALFANPQNQMNY